MKHGNLPVKRACPAYRWFILFGMLVLSSVPARAVIQGACPNCHTMHNSQGNTDMTFEEDGGPNNALTRGSCIGCHAQAGSQALVTLGPDTMPQVMHTETTDLAGGNFAYITGDKGSGASDNKGHNVPALTGADDVLTSYSGRWEPGDNVTPGYLKGSRHDGGEHVNPVNCAGENGCHGYRDDINQGISGEHHNNVDGRLNVADGRGNSYRFLAGVKGYESPDWEYSASAANHNEYFGRIDPIYLGSDGSSYNCNCHPGASGPGGVAPPDGTISQYCGTCHPNFHSLGYPVYDYDYNHGVGDGASPWLRHPTDLALPASGEYTGYTTYSLEAPVARTGSVPASPSSTVTPGSDAVMCLSCHRAHASDYPDMLRWDYDRMIAGGGGADGTGCFTCHTRKDE